MDRPAGSWIASARETAPEAGGGPVSGATPPRDAPRGFEEAVLQGELDAVRRATEGSRNATLNQAAFNLAQVMPVDSWHSELMSAAIQAGLGRAEAANTIKSAMAGAARNPRPAHRMPGNGPARPVETLPGVDGYQETPGSVRGFLVDWAALWADDSEPEWLAEPLLMAGRLTTIYSPPGVGKSLLALDLAVAVSRGAEALGAPTRATSVLYLDYENATLDIRDRLQAMGHDVADLNGLDYWPYPGEHLPMLDTPQGGDALSQACDELRPGLVVIDTISRCVQGDENDNATWLNLYRCSLMRLKARGIAVLRLDHTGKDETRGARGGSAKSGDVDFVWRLSEEIKGETFVLTCDKDRVQVREKRIIVNRANAPLAHNVDTRTITMIKTEQIIQALDAAGLPPNAGRDRARAVLKAAGLTCRTDRLAEILRRRNGGTLELET